MNCFKFISLLKISLLVCMFDVLYSSDPASVNAAFVKSLRGNNGTDQSNSFAPTAPWINSSRVNTRTDQAKQLPKAKNLPKAKSLASNQVVYSAAGGAVANNSDLSRADVLQRKFDNNRKFAFDRRNSTNQPISHVVHGDSEVVAVPRTQSVETFSNEEFIVPDENDGSSKLRRGQELQYSSQDFPQLSPETSSDFDDVNAHDHNARSSQSGRTSQELSQHQHQPFDGASTGHDGQDIDYEELFRGLKAIPYQSFNAGLTESESEDYSEELADFEPDQLAESNMLSKTDKQNQPKLNPAVTEQQRGMKVGILDILYLLWNPGGLDQLFSSRG